MSFIIWKYSVTEVGFDEIKKKVVNPLNRQKDRCILWLPSSTYQEKSWHLTIRRIPPLWKTSSVPLAQNRWYTHTAMSAAAATFP